MTCTSSLLFRAATFHGFASSKNLLTRRLNNAPLRCHQRFGFVTTSSSSVVLLHRRKVLSGGFLQLDLGNQFARATLETTFAEECTIQSNGECDVDVLAMDAKEKDVVRVRTSKKDVTAAPSSLELTIQIPQTFHVSVLMSNEGSVEVRGKLEGDLNVQIAKKGQVRLEKIRGENCHVDSGCHGTVQISTYLEAALVDIKSDESFTCKRIMGEDVRIVSKDIKIGAIYCPQTILQGTNKVLLGTAHGRVVVRCDEGNIQIDSVNGSIDATTQHGDIQAHLETLAPSSHSILKATKRGDVCVSVNPQLDFDASLRGKVIVRDEKDVLDGFFTLQEEVSGQESAVKESKLSLSGQVRASASSQVKSFQDKLFSSGKIDKEASLQAALSTSFFAAASSSALASPQEKMAINLSRETLDRLPSRVQQMPIVSLEALHGKLHLKSISWMDQMKLKHKVK